MAFNNMILFMMETEEEQLQMRPVQAEQGNTHELIIRMER
jgi:hypothetical protein